MLTRRLMSFALLAWLLLLVPDLAKAWSGAMQNGMGYNTRGLSELEILALADELPADVPIYTNIGELYYLYRDRETHTLPRIYDPLTHIANQSVAAQWDAALAAMRETGGVVVWSPLSRYRPYLPTVEDMLAFGDLVVSEERAGGVVLRPRPQSSAGVRSPADLAADVD